MIILPFKADHAVSMRIQPAQQSARGQMHPEHLAALEKLNSFTVEFDDEPAMCFGWVELYPTRALIWSLLSETAGRHMLALTRIGKDLVASLPHRRIEAEVEAGFEAGRRWMEMIGLKCETPDPLRAYNASGRDAYIYAKVN